MNDVDARIASLARSVFGKDLGLDTLRSEEASWDSLNHLKLVIAFESEFGKRIPVPRIEQIQCLRELAEFA